MTAGRRPVRVALVGAGHAHLHLVRRSARLRDAGVDPVLIAPARFYYSGLASGVLSGALTPADAAIDIAALARAAGIDYRTDPVVGIDRPGRRLVLGSGESVTFDAASFNIGSAAVDPVGAERVGGQWGVKPLSQLFELRAALEGAMIARGETPTVVVVGGGQSGFEIAGAVTGLMERRRHRPRVFLVVQGYPSWAPPAALRRLRQNLASRGVTIVGGILVERNPGSCRLADGQRLPCDHLVLATGLEPPALIGDLDLPLARDGRLRLGPALCSIADDAIFGVGDCAVMDAEPRPAAGVFGVRAGPILLNNLAALGDGRPLRAYHPQKRWLSIMDLGDGRGLAMRGHLWSLGRPALRLKRSLDLSFIRRMRAPLSHAKDGPHGCL